MTDEKLILYNVETHFQLLKLPASSFTFLLNIGKICL